ncbi:hypothetical protein A2159_03720 [Candidatus Woesebacteria bacterium RBG_13_34_9]|uniref:Uncharacterized protein n=1 Tax=Candidatus Woesebacteria bacterium RBG_13_34_9 TaxID=1802477 RepID=A0A1F7X1N5_9BACT|nr:MAG: hypothetical protein A2159_03720 [Candidatus Woesebacteria bacterium RBG_13_34_9]
MLETPHVVVAAALALKIANPALAIPIALGSHFVLEKVPHWNPHLNSEMKKFGKISPTSTKIVFIDSFLALSLGTIIAATTLPNLSRFITIMICCLFSVLPDLIEAPYYFLKSKSPFLIKKWIPFQKSIQSDASPFFGIVTQVLIIFTSLMWILN